MFFVLFVPDEVEIINIHFKNNKLIVFYCIYRLSSSRPGPPGRPGLPGIGRFNIVLILIINDLLIILICIIV